MIIQDYHCPKCGVKFMEKDERGRVRILSNHYQFPIELENGDITHLAVCKDCFKTLKKKDHIEIFEAVKDYWKKEINDSKENQKIDKLSFKSLSKDPKYL